MRTFIAIPLPEHHLSILEDLQKELQSEIRSGVAWVSITSIHLTLKFLGEVDENRLSDLSYEMGNLCQGFTAFDLSGGGVGCFPNSRRARVIWSGIQADKRLTDLQAAVEAGCCRLGFPKEERTFSPHLTLGRVKAALAPSALDFLEKKIKVEAGRHDSIINVREILIFKSELLRTGARYTVFSRANLKPASEE